MCSFVYYIIIITFYYCTRRIIIQSIIIIIIITTTTTISLHQLLESSSSKYFLNNLKTKRSPKKKKQNKKKNFPNFFGLSIYLLLLSFIGHRYGFFYCFPHNFLTFLFAVASIPKEICSKYMRFLEHVLIVLLKLV